MTNAVGFTYAYVACFWFLLGTLHTLTFFLSSSLFQSDRDAKQRWANNVVGGSWGIGFGGIGGQILTGAVKNSVGKVFGK